MRFRSIPRTFPRVLVALVLSSTADFACSGNDTGAGGSGAVSTGTTTAGTTSTGGMACDACAANEVCVAGACQPVAQSCPCGVETYCDIPTNTCTAGCLVQADCSPGRVCNTDTRACFDGCLSSTECQSGLSCVDHQCQAGCGTTADCTAPGSVCVKGHCGCVKGEGLCNGACVSLSDPSNCGACGVDCQAPATCNGTACVCAPGVCAPQALVPAGVGHAYNIQFDGTDLYFSAYMGPNGTGIFRMPKNGGAVAVVTAKGTGDFVAGGGFVAYTVLTDGNTHAYDLIKVPEAGGVDVKIDSGPQAASYLGGDTSFAYWYRTDKWYSVDLAVGGGPGYLGIDLGEPTGGIVVNNDGLFWVSCTGGGDFNCHVYRYFAGTRTQLDQTGFNGFAATTNSLVVDGQYVYLDVTWPTTAIVRLPFAGAAPTTLLATTRPPHYLHGDGTNLYWSEDSMVQGMPSFIKRMPMAGGAATIFATFAWPPVVSSIGLDGNFVYWTQADGAVMRLAK